MPQNQIDLSQLATGFGKVSVTASSESDAERDSRLRLAEAAAAHKRQKEIIGLYAAAAFLLALLIWSLWALGSKSADPKAKEVAEKVLIGLLGAAAGFLLAKSAGTKDGE